MDEECSVLWAYTAHMVNDAQEVGLFAAIHLRVDIWSWLSLSVWPLDSGWNPEYRLLVVPNS